MQFHMCHRYQVIFVALTAEWEHGDHTTGLAVPYIVVILWSFLRNSHPYHGTVVHNFVNEHFMLLLLMISMLTIMHQVEWNDSRKISEVESTVIQSADYRPHSRYYGLSRYWIVIVTFYCTCCHFQKTRSSGNADNPHDVIYCIQSTFRFRYIFCNYRKV